MKRNWPLLVPSRTTHHTSRITLCCLLLAWLLSAASGMGAGLIIVYGPSLDIISPHPMPIPRPRPVPPERWFPMPHPVWAPLELAFVHANVRVKDQIATTSLEEEFYNPNSRQHGQKPVPAAPRRGAA